MLYEILRREHQPLAAEQVEALLSCLLMAGERSEESRQRRAECVGFLRKRMGEWWGTSNPWLIVVREALQRAVQDQGLPQLRSDLVQELLADLLPAVAEAVISGPTEAGASSPGADEVGKECVRLLLLAQASAKGEEKRRVVGAIVPVLALLVQPEGAAHGQWPSAGTEQLAVKTVTALAGIDGEGLKLAVAGLGPRLRARLQGGIRRSAGT